MANGTGLLIKIYKNVEVYHEKAVKIVNISYDFIHIDFPFKCCNKIIS